MTQHSSSTTFIKEGDSSGPFGHACCLCRRKGLKRVMYEKSLRVHLAT